MTNETLSTQIINTFDGYATKYPYEFIEKILQENNSVIPRVNYKLDFEFNQKDTTTIGVDTPENDTVIQNAVSLSYIKNNLSEVIEQISNEIMNTFKSFKLDSNLNQNMDLYFVDMRINDGNEIDINDYLGVYLRSKEGINLEGIARHISRTIIMNIVSGNIKGLFLEKIKLLTAEYRKTEKNALDIYDLIQSMRDETLFIGAESNINFANIFNDMDYNDLIQLDDAYSKMADEIEDKEILYTISSKLDDKQVEFNAKLNAKISNSNNKKKGQ